MLRMIATDLDGTLVRDGTLEIDPGYEPMFERLLDMGVEVVIASGRQYKSSLRLFPNIAHRLSCIADGGATYRIHGENHAFCRIPEETVNELLRDFATLTDPELDISLNSTELCFVPHEGTRMHLWLRDSYKFDFGSMPSPTECPRDEIIKMAVYHPTDAEGALGGWFLEKWGKILHASSAGRNWVDFVMPGVNKGRTLSHMMEVLGVDPADAYAFGDNQNDLEMAGVVGHFLCVENARPEVRAVAERILPPYWEQGVLQFLEEYLNR